MRLSFGEFLIDRGRRELLRDGVVVHLSPKAFRLLEILVDAAPDGVARDDLYNGLWPDTFVAEANLPNLINELRKGLGDDRRNPRYIKTLHGFGYAFNEVPRPEAGAAWTPFILHWTGEEFPLREGENVIGRDASADIRVDSAGVSRRHASIVATVANATIHDLGSKNGTYVDGARIAEPTPITDNVEIRLGSAVLRLRTRGRSGTTMTFSPHADS